MSVVQYWPVTLNEPSDLSLSVDQVCAHLCSDWIPSLPAEFGPTSFIGWPPALLSTFEVQGQQRLALHSRARGCERQWKIFMSWMLGVAGARHIVAEEGYSWIAPVSAFLESAKPSSVDLSNWPPQFSPKVITVKKQDAAVHLMPDYLALRPDSSGVHEWAVVEAKGCRENLGKLITCPIDWSNQCHNVTVTEHGEPVKIDRHIVVATRVNPNAKHEATRQLQIRAWNRKDLALPAGTWRDGVIDVVSVHLIGLFRTLGLFANAKAITDSIKNLRGDQTLFTDAERDELIAKAEREIGRPREVERWVFDVNSRDGRLEVEVAKPLINLAFELQRATDSDEAFAAIVKAETRLGFRTDELDRPVRRERAAPFGITARWRRR